MVQIYKLSCYKTDCSAHYIFLFLGSQIYSSHLISFKHKRYLLAHCYSPLRWVRKHIYRKSNTDEAGSYQPIPKLKKAWQTWLSIFLPDPVTTEQTFKSAFVGSVSQIRHAGREKQSLTSLQLLANTDFSTFSLLQASKLWSHTSAPLASCTSQKRARNWKWQPCSASRNVQF